MYVSAFNTHENLALVHVQRNQVLEKLISPNTTEFYGRKNLKSDFLTCKFCNISAGACGNEESTKEEKKEKRTFHLVNGTILFRNGTNYLVKCDNFPQG